ncbi:heavy-metal-associated domain-containing protein [Candidatus Woesearchaeota archaeon]|nr:heavy-metal-associated domain-containing protein [Candidatus Woesearchaeota archaeon]
MKTVTLKIKGMHCKSCGVLVSEEVKEIKGIGDVKVDVPEGKATITYDEKTAKPEQLIAAVKKAGYVATVA